MLAELIFYITILRKDWLKRVSPLSTPQVYSVALPNTKYQGFTKDTSKYQKYRYFVYIGSLQKSQKTCK